MNITVCIKQVPAINDLKIDPNDYTLVRTDTNQILNPSDKSALETAFTINDEIPGHITALSMGRNSAKAILNEALNLGADRAFLISDKKYAGSDTCATATILSSAIKYLGGSDLIICGSRSADGETGQVGPELAVALHIPCITNVVSLIEVNESSLIIKKQTDGGLDILQVDLPALICVDEGSFNLRPPGIESIRKAKTRKVEILDNSVLNIDENHIGLKGSPTRVIKIYTPRFDIKIRCIQNDGTEAREALIDLIEKNMKKSAGSK